MLLLGNFIVLNLIFRFKSIFVYIKGECLIESLYFSDFAYGDSVVPAPFEYFLKSIILLLDCLCTFVKKNQ
jgi:hypothetical protein